jgi:hypothetical protein
VPFATSRRLVAASVVLAALIACLSRPTTAGARVASPAQGLRSPDASPSSHRDAFVSSWYGRPHDDGGVTDPLSPVWIAALKRSLSDDYVELGGVGDTSVGGKTFYRVPVPAPTLRTEIDCFPADSSNPCNFPNVLKDPPTCVSGALECFKVNVQDDWVPGDSSDSVMVVYDQNQYSDKNGDDGNYGIWLYHLCPPLPFTNSYCDAGRSHSGRWTAEGLSVAYLDSNGLNGCWPTNYRNAPSAPWLGLNGDPANFGHFGVPPPYQSIRYDEVVNAATGGSSDAIGGVEPIPHMLKIVLPQSFISNLNFFPSTGTDGDPTGSVPMGSVIRIKPDVTITRDMVGGNRFAFAIALTMQTYGAIVGDSGDSALMGTENLVLEGPNHRWSDLGLTSDSLSGIPLDDYEFLYRGYGGPSKFDYNFLGGACEDIPLR